MNLTPADVGAMERATIAAVAPEAVAECGDWLVGLDPGTVRRAHSAVPLHHAAALDVEAVEALFQARGYVPTFRVADADGLEPARAALAARGYAAEQPTLVQVTTARALRAVSDAAPAELATRPDAGWAAVFTGPGFEPADAAHRLALLSRSPDAAYATVRAGETAIAVGCVAFGHGWASVHGMRTAQDRRGEGLAGRVLAALAQAAAARGIDKVFLQVEEGNAPARALYARAGFETRWRYRYWRR